MKLFIILINAFVSIQAYAGSVDDVPMNCLEKAEKRMDSYKRLSLVSACRDRHEPNKEYYTFCEGSGCTGFTTTYTNKICKLTDWWSGQDDQDPIDPTEWKKGCLTSDDFSL